MKSVVKFKGIDRSEALVQYVTERFARLQKLEIRPLKCHITFSAVKHKHIAEVYVHGINGDFRAKAMTTSYQESVDQCAKKIERQLEREKSKIKRHRHYERSAEARLIELVREEKRWKRAG